MKEVYSYQPQPQIRSKAMTQHAKTVVSDSPALVNFAIGLVIFFCNLPHRQVLFWGGNSNYRIVINPANQKGFWAS